MTLRHSAWALSVVILVSLCQVSHFLIGYAECHYAECYYAECPYAECPYAECPYAECPYAVCCFAQCRGANLTEAGSMGQSEVQLKHR
jgi:hypothetical protein